MGIGSLLADWVEDRVEDWRDRLFGWISAVMGAGADFFLEGLEDVIIPDMSGIIDRLKADPNTPPEAKPLIDRLGDSQHPIAGILLIPIAVMMLIPMFGAIFEPFVRLMYYEQERVAKSARMDPQTATLGFFRVPEKESKFESDLRDTGWTDGDIEEFRRIYKPLLKPDEIRQLILRGEDPEGIYRAELLKSGYSEVDAEALAKLYQIIPGVQDLIRMAVREVFSPEIAEEFGQFEDLPADFVTWAQKQGISPEWAGFYWAAHWDLPSINQAFEMYHRTTFEPTAFSGDPIGESDGRSYYRVMDWDHLNLLLRALDVMPAWRDKLTHIATKPYTRVDVRRMFRSGVLKRDEVKRTYIDLQYDEEHAENLTEFTVRNETESQRGVTESKILKAYRQGDIDESVALELLQEIGYSEDDDQVEARRDLTVSNIKSLYFAEINERPETAGKLADVGYTAEAIVELLELWDLERIPAVRVPSRSELTHFLGIDIIDEAKFRSRMIADGYQKEHIDWYLQEHADDELEAVRKEETRARTEQDRVESATAKTDYETARARLDVDIAARRTFIAEKTLAILRTEDEELKAEYKDDIVAARLEVAKLQAQKAGLKL